MSYPPSDPPPPPGPRRLTRSRTNRVVGGVCAGIADYLNMDPTLVRIVTVLLTLFTSGLPILAYVLAYFLMPEEGATSPTYPPVGPPSYPTYPPAPGFAPYGQPAPSPGAAPQPPVADPVWGPGGAPWEQPPTRPGAPAPRPTTRQPDSAESAPPQQTPGDTQL